MKVLGVILLFPLFAWANHDIPPDQLEAERNERLYIYSCERASILLIVEKGNAASLTDLVKQKKPYAMCKGMWDKMNAKYNWDETNAEVQACVNVIEATRSTASDQKESANKQIDRICLHK